MKKETLPKGIIQGLLFNIGIFIIFIALLINYFFPEYSIIEEKKDKLNTLQLENKKLLKEWLAYNDFKALFFKNDLTKNEYLKNIFNDPSKDIKGTYESNLINKGTWSYDNFISKKIEEIKNKELSLSSSKIKQKIEKILPYYKDNSSLDGNGLTDFKFINYIEKIIHNFWLEYVWNIGIWDFSLEESELLSNKKKTKSQLEWEIYSFKLPLTLTWKKKNIIDFIYYIENVWSVSFIKEGKDIEIKEISRKRNIKDKKWNIIAVNDFYNIPRYFLWEKDILNNIVVDIENIKLKDYIDSSLNPIDYDNDLVTFVNFIKNDQPDEKYEITIDLKFYVKWLEIYKTKKYIDNVVLKYNKLSKIISSGIQFWKNNKSKLSARSKISLKELEKQNNYLSLLSKEIKNLSNKKRLEKELWNVYIEAQKYEKVFDTISKSLDIHLKDVSENIYKKYKESTKINK